MCQDIVEILLMLALNTNQSINGGDGHNSCLRNYKLAKTVKQCTNNLESDSGSDEPLVIYNIYN